MTKYLAMALLLSSVALAVGWAADRSRLTRANGHLLTGHAVSERNEATIACIWGCNNCGDELRQRNQKKRLCKCVVDSWVHRDQISAATNKKDLATIHAGEALRLLGYKTPDEKNIEEFLKVVLTVTNDGSNSTPEIHDALSIEHGDFVHFVKSAITLKNGESALGGMKHQ